MRRVALVPDRDESDYLSQTRLARLRHNLEAVGWVNGANLRLDVTYAGADTRTFRKTAEGAAKAQPDLIWIYAPAVRDGALIAYGPAIYDTYQQSADADLFQHFAAFDVYQRSAAHIDCILKGAKPADLPVQAPTKYNLSISTGAAGRLGLTVPSAVMALADEVIE